MDEKVLDKASIPVRFAKITALEPVNPELTRCKIYVQGVGKNRNYSYMGEDSIKAALPSLAYVPVVGHLMQKFNEDGEADGYYFGSHDYVVDDDLNVKAQTVPFGVVIDESFSFEDVEEFGKKVRYLTCQAYLWTGRYPELKEAIYDDKTWFNQSMEITRIQYRPLEEDSNYTEFLTWNYSALCILGKSDDPDYDTEPCYISAHIEPVQFDLGSTQFHQLMGELKEQLAFCFDNHSTQKGGNSLTLEERDEIFSKFSLTPDAVDFEITDDMTAEQLTEKLEAFTAHVESGAGDSAPESFENHEEEPALFSLTYRQKDEKLRQLCRSLNSYKKDASDNITEEIYCHLIDFDDSNMYYEVDRYTADGYEEKNLRCAYSFHENGEAAFSGEAEEVFLRWLTSAEMKQLDDDKAQLDALTKFKHDTEKAAYEAKVGEMLQSFSDIAGLDEFSAIKDEAENSETYDISNFEMRLFALRGKQVKMNKQPQAPGVKVAIDPAEKPVDDDGYGGLVSRAHNRRK